jgi:hypothetical protein
MPALDLTKPVQTRDGRPVRILCTDRKGTAYPVVALVGGDRQEVIMVTESGRHFSGEENKSDLVNVPVKIEIPEVWLNVFREADGALCVDAYRSREEADAWADKRVVACIPITVSCNEGDGL